MSRVMWHSFVKINPIRALRPCFSISGKKYDQSNAHASCCLYFSTSVNQKIRMKADIASQCENPNHRLRLPHQHDRRNTENRTLLQGQSERFTCDDMKYGMSRGALVNAVSGVTLKDSSVERNSPNREVHVFMNGDLVAMKSVQLYSAIKRLSIEQVLALVQHSLYQLDKIHLALLLKRLYVLSFGTKTFSERQASLLADFRFKMLCAALATKARFLEPSIAADMLVFLVHIGVTSDNIALQIFLQIVTKQLNGLTLDQVAVVADSVEKLKLTQEINVLLEACRVLCKTREHQLSTLSVNNAVKLLRLYGATLSYYNQLSYFLWNERHNIDQPHTAVSLLAALAKTDSELRNKCLTVDEHILRLEHWCMDLAFTELGRLTMGDIKELLTACLQIEKYNFDLFYELETVVSENCNDSWTDQLAIWHLFAIQGYFPTRLSSAVMRKATDQKADNYSLDTCVLLSRILAEKSNLSYNVMFSTTDNDIKLLLEQIDERIVNLNSCSTATIKPGKVIESCLYMIFAGHLPSSSIRSIALKSIDMVLHANTWEREPVHDISIAEKSLLLLQLWNSTDKSENDRLCESLRKTELQAFGAAKHDLSRLAPAFKRLQIEDAGPYHSGGLHADHLIRLPSGQKRIAVMSWYCPTHFWQNVNRLQCIPYLYATTFQKVTNTNVALVNTNNWLKLTDREKLLYLNEKLKQCESEAVVWL